MIDWIPVSDPRRPAPLSPVLVCRFRGREISMKIYLPDDLDADDSILTWFIEPLGRDVTHWAEMSYPPLPSVKLDPSFWEPTPPKVVKALKRLKADLLAHPARRLMSAEDFYHQIGRIRDEIQDGK